MPVPEWHRGILDERLKDYEANPKAGESWDVVRERLRDNLRKPSQFPSIAVGIRRALLQTFPLSAGHHAFRRRAVLGTVEADDTRCHTYLKCRAANAQPDPVLRYRSKSSAGFSLANATTTITRHGVQRRVCKQATRLCSPSRTRTFDVMPV